jgi:protein-S-isoprenylcysteine O-methyltransferase Ste14
MLKSVLLILLSVFAWGLFHSLMASLWAKARARQLFGPLAERGYRLSYNLIAGITLLPVFALVALLPDRELYAFPLPWSLLTLALQAAAAVALAAGLLQTGVWSFLGLRQLLRVEDAPPQLVVRGLYRWVRHPLYTAGLVLIWLSPVMTANLLALNAGLTIYIVAGAMLEERKLQAEFGEAYAAYKRRTPMLIPGARLVFSPLSPEDKVG